MEHLIAPFSLFIIAAVCACLLAVAVPFALWYYLRAKEIAPLLTKKAALETIIENLTKDIHAAREQLDKLTEDVARAKETIAQGDQAKQWLVENKKTIDDLEVQVAKVKAEYEGALQQLQDVQKRVSDKQLELAELNKKLGDVGAKIDEAQKKIEQLPEEYRKVREQLETEVNNLRTEKGKLETEIAAFKAEKEILVGQIVELKNDREQLKDGLLKLESEIKEKTEALKHLVESKHREIDAEIARKRKELETEIAGRREQLERELQARRDSFAKDLANQTKQLEEMRAKQLDELKREIDVLKQQKDSLSKDVAEYQALKSRNDSLRSENFAMIKEMDGLRKRLEAAKIDIARSEAIKNNEANMWKDLERKIDSAIIEEPAWAEPEMDEVIALGRFKEALDESGYAFNERTIKAFHTGLLCGGVSPLVVLSGISGTGKSLLPELYAKAFGMNFLPVAVQPRWDGPQDVFGFYNHMEGRFKATELSRLLWQFDIFNNENAKSDYTDNLDQLPMSLVLLDEMNLARVEYYFSELLSKLEIRNRVIDPLNKDERAPAEVELEYGASSVTDAKIADRMARRIFVNRNILFVGTMNEDESTQTLSSKVIDRSNVLRFGTPESLPRQPDGGRFNELCRNFVSFDTWMKWATKDSERLSNIDDYIAKLKEALKQVDRGFGHRTERAIKKYVQLYPGNKQDALADQIEMKILPKLNGVELDLVNSKVRGRVVEVLQAIRDVEVTEALNLTLRSEATFFNFKGVRR